MQKSAKKSRAAAANDYTGPMSKDTLKAYLVYHGLLPIASVGEVIFWIRKISAPFGRSSPRLS